MRIGIFGGSFDPVHLAHLVLAETCREVCQLDQVRFIPASSPPHKPDVQLTPDRQRVNMLEFATAGIPEFVIDQRELKRGGVSYTCETLQALREEFPEAELFFLMGADSLRDLPTWREPERIAALATIVAVNRGPMEDAQMQELLAPLAAPIRDRVQLVEMPGLAISASDLRARVGLGKSIRFLTPRPVERFIVEHQLYRAGLD